MRSFEKMILDFIDILEELEKDYVIIGGIAVSSWGNPRTTRGLDIIIVLETRDTEKLYKTLEKRGFSVNKKDIEDALEEKSHFTIFDKCSEYHIDAKGVYNEFDALTLKNKSVVPYEGHNICVASPEDTVAHKLLFGGYQDVADVEGILLRQRHIDMEYLEELCKKLGVLAELHDIREKMRN